jgi:hypothetical protein
MGGHCHDIPQSNICCNQTCRQFEGVRPNLGDTEEAWCLHADNPRCRTAIPQTCATTCTVCVPGPPVPAGPVPAGPVPAGPVPAGPVPAGSCPDRMLQEDQYTYQKEDWGGSGATAEMMRKGMQNAACVWVGVCQGDDDCLSRCPVAMGIAGMESNFSAATLAGDGGYGLWQVGGPSAPATGAGFSPCDGSGEPGDPSVCSAYNPITLGKWVRDNTSNGANWDPPGRCWTTCIGRHCNCAGKSAWDYGWTVVSGTPRPDGIYPDEAWKFSGNGGAKSYSMSETVHNACQAAIQAVHPGKPALPWKSPDSCTNTAPSPAACPPSAPSPPGGWKCTQAGHSPFAETPTGTGKCTCAVSWDDANNLTPDTEPCV